MTSTDAANLLIALNASELAKNVERTVPLYANIKSWGSDDVWTAKEEARIKSTAIYKSCAPGTTLSQAISNLIELSKAKKGRASALQSDLENFKLSPKDRVWLDIVITRPNPFARIEVRRFTRESPEVTPRLETALSMEFDSDDKNTKTVVDRIAEYKCTDLTLQALANCIFD